MPATEDTLGFGLTPRLLLGLGLSLFGVVLLLGQLDVLDARAVLRFWPLILIAIGLLQFFNPRVGASGERRFPVNGVIWMAIGGILLLNSLGTFRVSIWELFWPIVLIVLGLRLMTRQGRRFQGDSDGSTAPAASGDIGPIFAVLAGVKRVSAPQPFRGAEVTTFRGGAHIDLRQALLPPGAEAVLDVFAVMGGCELLIPAHWVVSAPIVAVMGGVDDKRIVSAPTVIEEATARGAQAPRLVIRGLVMLGGVTIRG
jgi:predicted membrane protein